MTESPSPARWIRAHWQEENIQFFFELDADKNVLRQIELLGSAKTPTTAASLTELPSAMVDGLEAVREYERTFGWIASGPADTWDGSFTPESISHAEFSAAWTHAREALRNGPSPDEDCDSGF